MRRGGYRLATLAAERLQSADAAEFWGGLVALLYAAAASGDAAGAEKVRQQPGGVAVREHLRAQHGSCW